jgi:hypothetical protein
MLDNMRHRHVKLFESWINEATTEASDDEIQNLLNLMVPIIKKSVDDIMRIELDYAKRLADVDNDNERSKLFIDLNMKKDQAEKPLEQFLSSRGKISQSQMDKILSWSKTMKSLLLDKEMSTKEEDFKKLGVDVSKWKEMYDPGLTNNKILLRNRDFEKETGIKPPLVTG